MMRLNKEDIRSNGYFIEHSHVNEHISQTEDQTPGGHPSILDSFYVPRLKIHEQLVTGETQLRIKVGNGNN